MMSDCFSVFVYNPLFFTLEMKGNININININRKRKRNEYKNENKKQIEQN
jgi:hypothetical protein